jgi:23S rRNA (adenine2503-C2)-methyltransferase
VRIQEIRERLQGLGARPEHVQRVLRDWVQCAPHDRGRRRPVDYLPKNVRDALPLLDAEVAGLARVLSEHPGEDGSARLLVGLARRWRACCCRAMACACPARSDARSAAASA